ncbi:MAG: response regulator [Terriglobia bacterium]
MKTRILIADDHEIVREGLVRILESIRDVEVVAQCATGREAVTRALALKPDIAILDITMPELNGLEATRQILLKSPKTEILILTVHESEQLAQDVLETGAKGYLLKSDATADLLTALALLRQHRPFFTSRVARLVLENFRQAPRQAARPQGRPLTPREREILQLLAEGYTNKEVASRLNISVKTAETHRANIMRKLDLHSLSELVRYAIRNNLIQP